jgi:hypothetical protein
MLDTTLEPQIKICVLIWQQAHKHKGGSISAGWVAVRAMKHFQN